MQYNDYLSDKAIQFDGLDDAIVGYGQQWGSETVLIYSVTKILEIFQKEMTEEEAEEWFSHNIECLYAGKGTPILIYDQQ